MTAPVRELLLVTGGARSGKSRHAQLWAEARGETRLYLATARVLDQEMAERVRKHRAQRGPGWNALETPLDPRLALLANQDRFPVMLLDCVTLWLTNLLMENLDDAAILARAEDLAQTLPSLRCPVAVVTNETGWGVIPANALSRRFTDLAGLVNQRLAQAADHVVLLAAGLPLVLKSSGRPSALLDASQGSQP